MGERWVVSGGRPLHGRLCVQGAKNAALPMIAAALLAGDPCHLVDAPRLRDVQEMAEIAAELGAAVDWGRAGPGGWTLTLDARGIGSADVPAEAPRRIRSSALLLGALLARRGRVAIPQPGGCEIGPRPIDLHLRGLEALGARVREERGTVVAEAAALRGADIHLDLPSVGATENLMLAATAARGRTVLLNAAREPEVAALQGILCRMGARVRGAGTSRIVIDGGHPLSGGTETVIPDRIEAGTWLLAAQLTGGELTLDNAVPEHVSALAAKLEDAGCPLVGAPPLVLVARGRQRPQATDVMTLPYPGFPTDLQNQFMTLLAVAQGTSIVTETIFADRFRPVPSLAHMGAQITVYGRMAVVNGVRRLRGAEVHASRDLRGAAALLLAALAADGTTILHGADALHRGYADVVERLRSVGAGVSVEEEEEEEETGAR